MDTGYQDSSGTFKRWPSGQFAYYDGNVTAKTGIAGRDSLYSAEFNWETTELWKWANFYGCNSCSGAGNRNVRFGGVDGKHGIYASAHTGCATYCDFLFDEAEHWNTTIEIRDNTWLDMRSVATHEFGHWFGLNHSFDKPSTEELSGNPAMWTPFAYGRIMRTIFNDDVNGMKAARAYRDIVSANDSFEFGTRGFKLMRPNNVGSWTRYCDGGGYSSSCYVQWNGVTNSVYQDIHIKGFYGYTDQGFRTMWGQGRVRNRSGLAGQSVRVDVYNMSSATPSVPIGTAQCALPIDASWVHCTTPGFRPGVSNLRVQYYNMSGNNMDLDIAILG